VFNAMNKYVKYYSDVNYCLYTISPIILTNGNHIPSIL